MTRHRGLKRWRLDAQDLHEPGPAPAHTKRLMALSAAAMFAGATLVALVEATTPGGADFSIVPALGALVFVVILVSSGERLPLWALASLGPIGAALIGVAIATTDTAGDGAVLYVWPTLWMAYFFGRLGGVVIAGTVGVVHAIALLSLPAGMGYLDRWLDVMASVIVVVGVVCVLQERNERLLRRLGLEARLDRLTGLLNRRGFEERAGIELQRAHRDRASLAVASFDIDHFKHVNDEWGHEVGDRVLAQLGDVFRVVSRGTDVVSRVGGEEFVALLPDCTVEDARTYAERVRAGFAEIGGADLPHGTVSAGVTAAVAPAEIEPMLQVADTALYAAKAGGRDRTVVAPPAPEAIDSPIARPNPTGLDRAIPAERQTAPEEPKADATIASPPE